MQVQPNRNSQYEFLEPPTNWSSPGSSAAYSPFSSRVTSENASLGMPSQVNSLPETDPLQSIQIHALPAVDQADDQFDQVIEANRDNLAADLELAEPAVQRPKITALPDLEEFTADVASDSGPEETPSVSAADRSMNRAEVITNQYVSSDAKIRRLPEIEVDPTVDSASQVKTKPTLDNFVQAVPTPQSETNAGDLGSPSSILPSYNLPSPKLPFAGPPTTITPEPTENTVPTHDPTLANLDDLLLVDSDPETPSISIDPRTEQPVPAAQGSNARGFKTPSVTVESVGFPTTKSSNSANPADTKGIELVRPLYSAEYGTEHRTDDLLVAPPDVSEIMNNEAALKLNERTASENNPPVQMSPQPSDDSELPDWWNYKIADPNRSNAQLRVVSLADLISAAIMHSPRIRTIQRVPQISASNIESAKSVFDPVLSLTNKYTDTMEPVGNTLTTGGAPFLQDNIWDSVGRVSKRLEGGSEVSFYQKLGFKNSNSNFFTPQDQGTASVGMDVRVPLMNGAGREFNKSPIVIAELESSVAWDQYQVDLQKEIADIGTLYWNLHTTRALYLQQQRSVSRARKVLDKLEARVDYDASISQIAQAKAELSLRINELQASLQSIIEIEISLRERIGDPDLQFVPNVELIPNQLANELFDQQDPDLNILMAQALDNRMELNAEATKLQVADRRVFASRCGLAPTLDMVFNVYSSSLQGDSGVERAYQAQFGNTPGFSGGLEYELPYGRRNAKAAVQQAELKRQQAADLLQIQRNEIIADVHKAYTRWRSAKASYQTAKQAVIDMRRSVQQLQLRWEEFAFIEGPVSQGATPSLALDQLLAGQRRLADTEARLANAELSVAIAQQEILTATGSLLNSEVSVETDAIPLNN